MTDSKQQIVTSSESIPPIFVRYLKATSESDKKAVVQAHPSLFTDPVIEALDDARQQFNATMREVKEACRMIDAVSGSLEYTGAPVEVQPGEAKALLDEDAMLQSFATSLANLLDAREKAGRVLPTPQLTTATTNAAVSPSTNGSGASPISGVGVQQKPWFAQPALVLAVLSFLPAENIFMEAENVCRSWQTWLFEPEVSRFFWIACVQREYPQQLQALLQTEGEDLFQSDWRSIAMLCVAEAEGEAEAEAEGDSENNV